MSVLTETESAPGASQTSGERCVSVSAEDCDEANVNKYTKYKTASDLKLFYMWAKENSEHRDIKDIPPNELDSLLARMYIGLRKKDGDEYEPDTLTSIQNSIDRHIKGIKLPYCIKTDDQFSHSRSVLDSKRKCLKAMGKGNKAAKGELLTEEEVQILYKKRVLGTGNGESLLYTVWLNNGVYFGLRGRQEHTNLLWGDIKLKQMSDGKEYLEFPEWSTKTKSGVKAGDFVAAPKMFANKDSPHCPIRVYKEYKARRPPDLLSDDSRFYLRHIQNPTSNIWFSHQPLGKEKMGKILSELEKKAELTGKNDNHSTGMTFATTVFPLTTTLVQAGLTPTEVVQLHRINYNEFQSLRPHPEILQHEPKTRETFNSNESRDSSSSNREMFRLQPPRSRKVNSKPLVNDKTQGLEEETDRAVQSLAVKREANSDVAEYSHESTESAQEETNYVMIPCDVNIAKMLGWPVHMLQRVSQSMLERIQQESIRCLAQQNEQAPEINSRGHQPSPDSASEPTSTSEICGLRIKQEPIENRQTADENNSSVDDRDYFQKQAKRRRLTKFNENEFKANNMEKHASKSDLDEFGFREIKVEPVSDDEMDKNTCLEHNLMPKVEVNTNAERKVKKYGSGSNRTLDVFPPQQDSQEDDNVVGVSCKMEPDFKVYQTPQSDDELEAIDTSSMSASFAHLDSESIVSYQLSSSQGSD